MSVLQKIRRYQKIYGVSGMVRKVYYRYKIKYCIGKKQYPFVLPEDQRQQQKNWSPSRSIRISLIVPLYNTPDEYLCQMLDSVVNQTYSDWELCLVDASDSEHVQVEQTVRRYQQMYPQIYYAKLMHNEGISVNTNQGLQLASGAYIGLLDHDDLLHPSALYRMARAIDEEDADFLYSDELSFDGRPDRVQSIHLKPDYFPETLRYNNYICHFCVFSYALVEKMGMFRREFDGSQDFDLFLRLTDAAKKVYHVREVLYYWRCHAASSASQAAAKPYAIEAGAAALREHLQRRKLAGKVESVREHPLFYKINYEIPQDYRVVIVTPDVRIEGQLQLALEQAAAETGCLWSVMTQEAFYQKQSGEDFCDALIFWQGRYHCGTQIDAAVRELLQCLMPPENYIAGAIITDRRDKICHAGYVYDPVFAQKIRPLYYGESRLDAGYMNRLAFRQNVSVLGGAVLAVRYSAFAAWQEWNRQVQTAGQPDLFSQQTWFSLCLYAKENGGDCILTPYTWFVTEAMTGSPGNKKQLLPTKETCQKCREWFRALLDQPDPCFNPGMRYFGDYYFLTGGKDI